jgi:hypothetical protein
MLRRLLVGLVIGFIVGGLVAAGMVAGLHIVDFAFITGGVALAYVAAAVTGVLTGLVAGKPIWASGAKIEAGLKAFFGALIGVGLMFALRQWVRVSLDLGGIGAGGPDMIGNLPAVSLPLVAAVLGGVFELDNTVEKEQAAKETSSTKKRVDPAAAAGTNGKSKARLPDVDEAGEEAEVGSRRAKR